LTVSHAKTLTDIGNTDVIACFCGGDFWLAQLGGETIAGQKV